MPVKTISIAALVLLLAGIWITAQIDRPPPQAVAPESVTEPAAPTQEAVTWPPLPSEPVALAANLVATNYLVLLDTSGSMANSECSGQVSKFDAARAALKAFAGSLGENDQFALAVFTDDAARLVLPFGGGASHRQRLGQALAKLAPGGATPLRGAIGFSFRALTEQAQRQVGYGTYRLVVITDGYSTDKDPKEVAMDIVRRSPIEVHAIGFCIGGSHSLNVAGYTRYYTADNPRQLAEGLAAVRAEVESFDATRLTID